MRRERLATNSMLSVRESGHAFIGCQALHKSIAKVRTYAWSLSLLVILVLVSEQDIDKEEDGHTLGDSCTDCSYRTCEWHIHFELS